MRAVRRLVLPLPAPVRGRRVIDPACDRTTLALPMYEGEAEQPLMSGGA